MPPWRAPRCSCSRWGISAPAVDGLHLLQHYVRAPVIGPSGPLITRAEFIGGRFLYAVEVDTSDGFELCPADVCAIDDAFCPAGTEGDGTPRAKFTIIDEVDADLKQRYEAFLAANVIPAAYTDTARCRRGHRRGCPARLAGTASRPESPPFHAAGAR